MGEGLTVPFQDHYLDSGSNFRGVETCLVQHAGYCLYLGISISGSTSDLSSPTLYRCHPHLAPPYLASPLLGFYASLELEGRERSDLVEEFLGAVAARKEIGLSGFTPWVYPDMYLFNTLSKGDPTA